MRWTIAGEYNDGTIDYISAPIYQDGWNHITFAGDSAKVLRYVYGTVTSTPAVGEVAYLDSISLVRTRYNPDKNNRQAIKRFTNGKKTEL